MLAGQRVARRIFRAKPDFAWLRAAVGAGALAAMGFALPPVDGTLSGDFAVSSLGGAPRLHWTLQVQAAGAAKGRAADIAIDGPGTRVRGRIEISETGAGTWRLTEGTIEVAAWAEVLRAQLGSMAEGVTASGTVTLEGGGQVNAGRLTGGLALALRDGRIAQEAQGWSLEPVTLQGKFAVDSEPATVRSETPFEFSIGTIRTTRLGARNLFAAGLLRENFAVALSEVRVEVAGGRVAIAPTVVTLDPLALAIDVRVENVGLQDVAALVPAGLADAHGRIDGSVRMSWSKARGFQLGSGELTLNANEPAFVRLAPSPGFLTDRVPKELDLLPAWLGPVARWFRTANPAYDDMRQIELGQTELRVTDLAVKLTPGGDSAGRSAVVTLTARPSQPGGVVDEVTFAINVAGPLSEVLRLGFNQSFSVETH